GSRRNRAAFHNQSGEREPRRLGDSRRSRRMSTTPAPPAERPGYRARIERIQDHAADVRSLFLRCVDRPLPVFLPGMFISIAIPLIDEVRVRPYTIASLPA